MRSNADKSRKKVTGVKLSCTEAVFPTTAIVTLSSAKISNPGTKAISFTMFPENLSGKKILMEVPFEGGKSKIIEKDGTNFVRNTCTLNIFCVYIVK